MSNFLERAFTAHVTDKDRMRRAILRREPTDPEEIRRDDLCELGGLLHGEGARQYGCDPVFKALKRAHAEFHSAAYDAYSLYESVHEDILSRDIEAGDFLDKSKEIIRLIAKLRVKAEERSTECDTGPGTCPLHG